MTCLPQFTESPAAGKHWEPGNGPGGRASVGAGTHMDPKPGNKYLYYVLGAMKKTIRVW